MTHRYNVLFERDILGQSDEGDVVLESAWVVVGMDLLLLYLVVLVGEGLALLPHVPLAEPDLHPADGGGVHAVGGGHDEPVHKRR